MFLYAMVHVAHCDLTLQLHGSEEESNVGKRIRLRDIRWVLPWTYNT
jgi:hypothetical protein